MELAIDELQRRHPNLDRMMCETLFKLHEQGKLDAFLPKLDDSSDTHRSVHPSGRNHGRRTRPRK